MTYKYMRRILEKKAKNQALLLRTTDGSAHLREALPPPAGVGQDAFGRGGSRRRPSSVPPSPSTQRHRRISHRALRSGERWLGTTMC
uniref:Uncharacterized protein n=1 Tax=Setaria viridis TaxID=4556 RepID=A0A4U6TMG0_SETVI|nr:hypothetical protein SEVIR_8G245901v2 [Setaria viridis]TKW02453.1 hypothetical protein SEVIR_8G245901v2 [Setaria viridis]TKW02454.1 hypothetical protein SEVIR_8G245901v2 [Setaria viridis]